MRDEFTVTLLSLLIPIALQNLMSALVSVSDSLMLGFVSQNSLSAVSLATQVQFVFSLASAGICSGLAIMLAQYWGKRDTATMNRIIPYALKISTIVGLLFSLSSLFLPKVLMLVFTNETVLIEAGVEYLRVVAISFICQSISLIFLEVIRNTGKAKISSMISSCSMMLNIVLNTFFIFGLDMGIKGAAFATSITRVVELLWAIYEKKRDREVDVRFDFNKTEAVIVRDFWKYATPTLGAALVWGIAFSMHSVILGHMGSDAVAANSIASIAKQLLCCVNRGLAGATGIMVGNVLGANHLVKGKEYGWRLTKLSLIFGIVTGIAIVTLSPFIVSIANISPVAKDYLKGMLWFMGIYIVFQTMNMVILDGVFTAGGDAKYDMLTNIYAMWMFCIPLGLLSAFVLKLNPLTVFLIINIDEIVKFPWVAAHYRKYIWVKNITH